MDELDLRFATITEQQRLLQAGEISAVELAQIYLASWEQVGNKLNAVAEITPELALTQAQRTDEERARGQLRGPLHGIPYGAKDLLATGGIPTRWGSPAHRDQVFDYDAAVIEKLRDAGTVLLGKLAMVELAGGGGYEYASASLHGPGRNPWDPERWAGGSSSGSGAAVAAGMVSFALGSETWGSIMTPAGFCGVSGLRPSLGSVSSYGAMSLAWTMDKIGPLARSAQDCALVFDALAGYDPRDPASVSVPLRLPPQRRFRIGVLPVDFTDAPETEKAFTEAVHVLRDLGMNLQEVELPDYPYGEIARTILGVEAAAAHEALITSGDLDLLVDQSQREGLRKNLEIRSVEYAHALQQRAIASRTIAKLFNEVDALVSPTLIAEAPPIEQSLNTSSGRRRTNYSVLGALAGVPALSVPMGFGEHGLPLGLTLTGALYHEQTILAIGMAYQSVTDWHLRRPPHDL